MSRGPIAVLLIFFASVAFVLSLLQSHHHLQLHHKLGFCGGGKDIDQSILMAAVGAPHDSTHSSSLQNSPEILEIARFAVEQHNNKENAVLELVGVAKAQEQVVAGTLHHLTLEVIEAGRKKLYEAKVWVKPWMNFKELQEFKYVGDIPSFTPSDLGVKREPYGFGLQSVPVHDPNVQDAADHAVKTIQQRSNSLIPYELLEILDAKAEVAEESAKFDMLIKVKRGEKVEKFKVQVHQNKDGAHHLEKMENDRT